MVNLELFDIFITTNGLNKASQKLAKDSLISLDKFTKRKKVLVKMDRSLFIVLQVCLKIHFHFKFMFFFFFLGVGRTGVFLTLSIVFERIRYEGVVDVFQTVKLLRTQRPALVQTEVISMIHSILNTNFIHFRININFAIDQHWNI